MLPLAGLTAAVVLGDENPDDTTIDAGLTSAGQSGAPRRALRSHARAGRHAALDHRRGSGLDPDRRLALVASGLSCLFAARRPPLP